jgi:hypothetical protein
MNKDISGMYKLLDNDAFIINSHEWQINNKGKKQYIIDTTTDSYISGLFRVKGVDGNYMTFDFEGIYYLLHIDNDYIYIQYINNKINK